MPRRRLWSLSSAVATTLSYVCHGPAASFFVVFLALKNFCNRRPQSMAVEMRARESVNMSEDLTRPIAPYATALHYAFLHSHCSSCFHSLPSQSPRVLSCVTCCSVRYCCSDCFSLDHEVHSSSGECCLFVNHHKKADPSYSNEENSDLCATLRFLYLLEMHGLVSSDLINHSDRIGGPSASGIGEVLEKGGEIAERILEGSLLISSARKLRAQTTVGLNVLTVEKMALWAVMTNGIVGSDDQ